MKKTFKTTLSLLMALALTLSLSATAFAQAAQPAADIVYRGRNQLIITPKCGHHTDTDLFGGFKGVMPGDTRTETITFRNESRTPRTDYVKLYIAAVPHGTDNLPVDEHITDVDAMNAFLSNFTMTVKQDGREIFSGKPNAVGAFGGSGCLLGTFKKGEGTTLTVALTLDITADSAAAANREGEVDWKFVAEEYTTTSGGQHPDEPTVTPGTLIQTGQLNWPVWVLGGTGLALVALGGAMLMKKKKQKHD